MKKVLVLLVFSLFAVSATFAQTEKGKFRVGGASNLSFLNSKADGADGSRNDFTLDFNAGYFVMNNLSVDAGVGYTYSKYKGEESSNNYNFNIGARYYLPVKVFFGAGLDFNFPEVGDKNELGLGLGLKAGYAWFLNDKIALEPAIGYRIGLTDKDKGTKFDQFGAQIGISIYF